MKKILSIAIVLVAVAMVSCGGNTAAPAETTEETVETVAVEAVDSCGQCAAQCDSAAVVAEPAVEVAK
ncbi:MAG: hypothetical protein RSB23_06125 [Alistipes sp.]